MTQSCLPKWQWKNGPQKEQYFYGHEIKEFQCVQVGNLYAMLPKILQYVFVFI
jgi:hypothetical protein